MRIRIVRLELQRFCRDRNSLIRFTELEVKVETAHSVCSDREIRFDGLKTFGDGFDSVGSGKKVDLYRPPESVTS